jgi:hypothetical protein
MRQSVQFLLPQHVSGTNMSIIRSTISEYLPLLGGHTWKAAWVVLRWAASSEHCSEGVARLQSGHILQQSFSIQHSAFSITFKIQHSAFSITFNIQLTFNIQHSALY